MEQADAAVLTKTLAVAKVTLSNLIRKSVFEKKENASVCWKIGLC